MFYDRSGKPITFEEWTAQYGGYKENLVARAEFPELGIVVSTVYRGTNPLSVDPPMIFQTSLLRDGRASDGETWATPTEAAAAERHKNVVEGLRLMYTEPGDVWSVDEATELTEKDFVQMIRRLRADGWTAPTPNADFRHAVKNAKELGIPIDEYLEHSKRTTEAMNAAKDRVQGLEVPMVETRQQAKGLIPMIGRDKDMVDAVRYGVALGEAGVEPLRRTADQIIGESLGAGMKAARRANPGLDPYRFHPEALERYFAYRPVVVETETGRPIPITERLESIGKVPTDGTYTISFGVGDRRTWFQRMVDRIRERLGLRRFDREIRVLETEDIPYDDPAEVVQAAVEKIAPGAKVYPSETGGYSIQFFGEVYEPNP